MKELDILKNISLLSNVAQDILNSTNVTLSGQLGVLNILKQQDGLNQYELAEILDIKPSSLTELLKKLESKNEIRREVDVNNSKIVYLTEQGLHRINSIQSDDRKIQQLFEDINDDNKAELLTLSNQLSANAAKYFDVKTYDDKMNRIDNLKFFREHFDTFGANKEFNRRDFYKMMHQRKKELKKFFEDEALFDKYDHRERKEMRNFMRNHMAEFCADDDNFKDRLKMMQEHFKKFHNFKKNNDEEESADDK